jgi:hypothetical protein
VNVDFVACRYRGRHRIRGARWTVTLSGAVEEGRIRRTGAGNAVHVETEHGANEGIGDRIGSRRFISGSCVLRGIRSGRTAVPIRGILQHAQGGSVR